MADYDQQSIINGLLPPPTNPAVSLSQGFLAGAKKAPGAVADALGLPDALKALRGQMTEGEQENLARDAVTGLIPFGKGLSAGAAKAIFAGMGARTADFSKLHQAKDLLDQGTELFSKHGVDPASARGLLAQNKLDTGIWRNTGWFQGADRKWRFEIPDYNSHVSSSGREQLKEGGTQPLSKFLWHNPLYEAYPELKSVPVHRNIPEGYEGMFFGDSIGLKGAKPWELTNRSTTLHEVQHAIQGRESFAQGTNSEAARLNLPENTGHPIVEQLRSAVATGQYGVPGEPSFMEAARRLLQLEREVNNQRATDLYRRTAGEVEARNVQSRMLHSPEMLRDLPPVITEDVPRSRQVVSHHQLIQALRGSN